MSEKKEDKFNITEIFTAKAGKDWSRYFHGTIVRERDDNGCECLVRGKIIVKTENYNGHILAVAKNQWLLGEKLDELVQMVLDYGLHDDLEIQHVFERIIFCIN